MTSFAIDVPPELIGRLRRGDSDAYAEVYRLFERPVFTLAYRLLGDRHEAQEILHDAMLTLFDKMHQFRGDSPFWGWLRQIAANEALMRMRRRRLDYVEDVPEPADTFAASPVSIDAADLERGLSALPALTRSVLWLYYVEGYKHDEIAAAFNRSVSFSKTQVLRGTQRLREHLQVGKESAYA